VGDLYLTERAVILSVGYELLQGRVVNTNATYISRKLFLLGYEVKGIISVGDNYDDIGNALDFAINTLGARIIITTGGLGPTYDDITADAIARYFKKKLILNKEAYEMIRSKYESAGMEMTESRIKMALLPEGAKPIPNSVGTAPGIHLKLNNIELFALPGVPKEMEAMFKQYVEPILRARTGVHISEGYLEVMGIPESGIAPLIKAIAKKYPIYIKSHPQLHEIKSPLVKIYIMSANKVKEKAKSLCLEACRDLENELRSFKDAKIIHSCECS